MSFITATVSGAGSGGGGGGGNGDGGGGDGDGDGGGGEAATQNAPCTSAVASRFKAVARRLIFKKTCLSAASSLAR